MRRRIYSSFVIAHPVNSDTLGEIVKMLCQELDIYMTLLIIDMDFLYQFNLGLIAQLFTVFFMKCLKKKCFLKLSKVGRSVIGWRSDTHVAIYGSRVAKGFSAFQRRSCL